MKKKTIKKKAPAYAFGIEDALSLANIAGGITQGLSDEFSKGDVAGQTISGAASGAMTGLSVGGPIGAAIGGVGGLLGGLFGARKRRKEAQRRARVKENQQEVAMGKSNAATAEQLYWEDNALASTFENGGILPDLAYVDNNEIIRDDAGNIMQVPNSKPGTDNHLIDASNLDSVLSDKLKRPGTNKTFAQEGKELVKMTKKSKGNDRFARTSDMLNSRHANIKYNQLLDEQESVKAKKGVKPKVKGIPAYEDGKNRRRLGREIPLISREAAGIYADWIGNALRDVFLTPAEGTAVNEALSRAYSSNERSNSGLGNITYYHSRRDGSIPTYGSDIAPYGEVGATNVTPTITEEPVVELPGVTVTATRPKTGYSTASVKTPSTPKGKSTKSAPTQSTVEKTPITMSALPDLPQGWMDVVNRRADLITPTGRLKVASTNTRDPKTNKLDFDPGNLAGLEPVLYNFVRSLQDPEVEDPVLNPYAGAVNRAMARRRLNIEPTLAANRRSRAINRQNMARLNPNTGMNLAYGNQLATAEYAQNASTYANRDNANNQYLGEYADMMNNLGQQYVQNTVLTNDLNARNRAAARNFGSTAAGQLGQWSQNRVQMRNQARRDAQLLPYLEDYLNAVTNVAKSNKLIV